MGQNAAGRETAIRIRGLTRSFANRAALRGIDLDVERGRSVVIFGPNGAGKTTLIKILATMIKPSSGSVIIDGLDLKESAEEVRRRIGVVTHQTFLYHNLTAYENLAFYCRLFDVPRPRERIHEVAALVAMTHRLDSRVGTLSRGMLQRISIARSLLHRPRIMLLDEPETGLDQEANSLLWSAFATGGEERPTVILTTHNLERGFQMCDYLVILGQGRVAYQCPRSALEIEGLRETYRRCTGAGA